MFDIITIGCAMKDVFVQSSEISVQPDRATGRQNITLSLGSKVEAENIIFETGGGGTNTAVGFANLGLKTAFFGKIGADSAGYHILNVLRECKVNTALVLKDKKYNTGYSTIISAKNGERIALVYRGANNFIETKEIPLKKLKTKWLYFAPLSGLSLKIIPKIIDYCKKNKIKVIMNPSSSYINKGIPKAILKNIDILLLNREEGSKLTKLNFKKEKEIFKKLTELTNGIVVMTEGKKGAMACDSSFIYKSNSLNVKVVNTLGAGDAFCSGFSYGIITNKGIEQAMRIGTANAASVIQDLGAKKGLLKKVDKKSIKKIKVKRVRV